MNTCELSANSRFCKSFMKNTFPIQARVENILSLCMPFILFKNIFRFRKQKKNHQSDTKRESLKHNVRSNGWMIVFGLLKL